MAHSPRPKREQWSGQRGFILAAIGSAIGLGNIWRFPGVAYENGGGAFLIPYLVALLTAGIPVLLFDYAIGHRFRGSAPTAFRRLAKRAELLGWFQVAICFVIILYYTVIIAWSASYLGFSVTRAWGDDPAGFFTGSFLQVAQAPGVSLDIVPGVAWPLLLIWVLVLAVLALGVQKGLERANVIGLPVLVVLFLAMVLRALFLPGALDGLNAFFTPDWSALSDPGVWIAAYSQIFFSLSVAFGIMVTYSSYLKRKTNLTATGLVVGFANSSFELLAGIGVFAALGFMAQQQGTTIAELDGIAGVSLAFIAFPQIISMMPGGPIFGVLFFASLTLAGLTSLLSLLQVVSAAFQEKFGLSIRQGAIRVGGVAAVVSLALFSTSTALPVLDTVDKYVNEVGIVASAIFATVLVTWVLRRLPELQRHLNAVSTLQIGTWWRWLVGVVVPGVLLVMFVSGLVDLVAHGYGDYPRWFTNTLGWGMLAAIVAGAFVLTALRWRHSPDEFVPDALPDVVPAAARPPRGTSTTPKELVP
ncbi:sodium-dependent transporter [Pengzhenrongella frigida]|uniref:Sodium-dependent transporter n=1 Tax=Pengzhenrongella frigida TaxID=1259133 RepID=A0A4Q5N1D1_9MICO|nr:sodium-dependent transporter [Cellulomonas sp. HLT2-17]RYV51879.1 sodium-dependent transporter [Cellulomonas sp. HLT2-17]